MQLERIEEMHKLCLNGSWQVSKAGKEETIEAKVPGCVHIDLMKAGLIEDPYYRENELDSIWIGETDWVYRRTFIVNDDVINYERILLRCNGLDTIATVRLNKQTVGEADNMFRLWEFDIKPSLIAGENTIEVYFRSPLEYHFEKEKLAVRPERPAPPHRMINGNWIRKEACNFGWDWGPKQPTSGIWRDIEILAFDVARIDDLHIKQHHLESGGVRLEVNGCVESVKMDTVTARIRILFEDSTLKEEIIPVDTTDVCSEFTIDTPQLWWPAGLGEQPLYVVEMELLNENADVIDKTVKRIGLRSFRLVRDEVSDGETFYFEVNGVPFFSKGANWIPADTFANRVTAKDYARLLGDAVAANMNMIRVWGGGIYEEDVFYDLCDQLGLVVWQDFMFACSKYPSYNQDFMDNVRAEAEDAVRRLRHHASLALWCGNNEVEQSFTGDAWDKWHMSWEDYSKLFDNLLLDVVRRLDPQTDYWPGSPHTPIGDRNQHNDPNSGDAHLWDVWHKGKPFQWYRTCNHRFISEFGFQSFPELETINSFTIPSDHNITSYVMEHHQRSNIGNTSIIKYMLDWFKLPSSFEMVLTASQILQGLAMKYAVEYWRTSMPRVMGALYWQLNDCWPVASWASIDYYGRWKALHFMARKFFAPLLIVGLENTKNGTVEIKTVNDLRQTKSGLAAWTLTDTKGTELDSGSIDVVLDTGKSASVDTLDLNQHIAKHGARNLMLWLELKVDNQIVSHNLVTLSPPKHLELVEPDISVKLKTANDGNYYITLNTNKPAMWTWLSLEGHKARFSDNFIHLRPNKSQVIRLRLEQSLTTEQLKSRLRICSLIDTYS